jgi:DNA polymerase III subunit epsilon
MKRPNLPVYYYHDHFVEMLAFVRATYGSILTDEHDAFVVRFQHLSKDAQCLLVRMVNRRGVIFNRSLFSYAEISDLERAAHDLLACGQARGLREEDYAAFVTCLPKDVLISGAKAAGRTDIRVSWPKAKLVDYFLAHVPFDVAAEHCGAAKFIALDDVRPLEFSLYLYFGKTEADLKNFALRDLGILRINKATSFKARFTDGDEARACFHYSRLLDRLQVKSLSVYQRPSTISLAVRIARAIMPATYGAERPIRSVSSLRSWARRISPGSFIAPVRRPNAMSGWSGCFTAQATR